jgi:hypothetical protein
VPAGPRELVAPLLPLATAFFGGPPPSRGTPSATFSFCVALALYTYIRLAFHITVLGAPPRGERSRLVLANHQHDVEGMVVPGVLYFGNFRGPWQPPIFTAASRRMFEPGFLYERSPSWLKGAVGWLGLGAILPRIGVLPIENMLRTRPVASFAYEVYLRHGDLPLAGVFSPEVVAELEARLGRPLAGCRLSGTWRGRLLPLCRRPIGLRALLEPYRTEVREALRQEVVSDLEALAEVLSRGHTLYLTPEGRLTEDGRLGRLKEALDRLLPAAQEVWLAATSYDPFLPGRLRFVIHLVGPVPGDVAYIRRRLVASRPVTLSQILAHILLAGEVREADLRTQVEAAVAALPDGAVLAPSLTGGPGRRRQALAQSLAALKRRRLVLAEGATLRLGGNRRDPRFPVVPDIVVHQANVYAETLSALASPAPSPLRERHPV